MSAKSSNKSLIKVRLLLLFFVFALIISGLTAGPLTWEVNKLASLFQEGTFARSIFPAIADWILFIHKGITDINVQGYQFLFYGTDWLAFAHIVIAIAFLGAIRDPVKNVWVIEFGMIACILVIPMALIAGQIRGIPFFWRLIDCSFGIFGILPLWICRKYIKQIAK